MDAAVGMMLPLVADVPFDPFQITRAKRYRNRLRRKVARKPNLTLHIPRFRGTCSLG